MSASGPREDAPEGEELWHLAALRLPQWNSQHVQRVPRPDHVWSRHAVLWVARPGCVNGCSLPPTVVFLCCQIVTWAPAIALAPTPSRSWRCRWSLPTSAADLPSSSSTWASTLGLVVACARSLCWCRFFPAQDSKIKFPLPHRVLRRQHKPRFTTKRPNTFYWDGSRRLFLRGNKSALTKTTGLFHWGWRSDDANWSEGKLQMCSTILKRFKCGNYPSVSERLIPVRVTPRRQKGERRPLLLLLLLGFFDSSVSVSVKLQAGNIRPGSTHQCRDRSFNQPEKSWGNEAAVGDLLHPPCPDG